NLSLPPQRPIDDRLGEGAWVSKGESPVCAKAGYAVSPTMGTRRHHRSHSFGWRMHGLTFVRSGDALRGPPGRRGLSGGQDRGGRGAGARVTAARWDAGENRRRSGSCAGPVSEKTTSAESPSALFWFVPEHSE